MTAAEFIAQAYEQFVAPMDKRVNYIDYVANRPGAQQVGGQPVGRQLSVHSQRESRRLSRTMREMCGRPSSLCAARMPSGSAYGRGELACVGLRLRRRHRGGVQDTSTTSSGMPRSTQREKHVHIHMILYSTDPREGLSHRAGVSVQLRPRS